MKKLLLAITVASASLVSSPLSASTLEEDISAPLGLTWGVKEDALQKESLANLISDNGRLKLYSLDKTPVQMDGFDTVYAIVDNTYGLVKISLVKRINGDTYGISGVELYKKYKAVLQKKYGKPTSYEYTGRKLYTESDEFYQCLKYDGCGAQASFFEPIKGAMVSIEMEGLSRGVGELEIRYQSSLFEKVMLEKEKKEQSTINDGL